MPYRHDFATEFGLETVLAAVVFGLVLATMTTAFVISRLRRRRRSGSSQRPENNPAELAYLAVLAVVAAFLATASVTMNDRETADPPKASLVVHVTAYQWCWRFGYAGASVTVTGQCEGRGIPTLMLPEHRSIRFDVTSLDVIHGFWIPFLRWKIYAYPGHVNSFTVTLAQGGTWAGRCSELCGLYHYEMDFRVRAIPPDRFTRWLRSQRSGPQPLARPGTVSR